VGCAGSDVQDCAGNSVCSIFRLIEVWTLALDTSTNRGSIALLNDGQPVQQTLLDSAARTAATITPAIAALLNAHELSSASIGLVAVSQGPGSFTGLRIGITTARVFAYAAGADVIAIDTIDAIAAQAATPGVPLRVVIDAQRGQVLSVAYSASGERGPTQTVDVQNWLDSLSATELVAGPVLQRLAPRIAGRAQLAPGDVWSPTALTTGRLAWQRYAAGERDDLWRIEPHYHRASAAEEKAVEKAEAAEKAAGE